MIESVMSVMEGDGGMDRQNIKNCFYFQRERGQILRDREYTEILRNLERKRHWKKYIEKYYWIL